MVIVAAISAAPRSTSMPPVKYAGSRASGTRPGILGLSRAAGPASALDLEAAMTVDVHAHFWTDDYLDKVAALSRTGTAALRGRGAGDGAELDARLALMDRAGVGMLVVGAIVEQVSGQSYYNYVREHVFKAAGMAAHRVGRAGYHLPIAPRERRQSCSARVSGWCVSVPWRMASAAAQPAASPVVKHVAVMRADPLASWVVETQRPPARRLVKSRATRMP